MAQSAWAKIKLENTVLREIVFGLLTEQELEVLKNRKRDNPDLNLTASVLDMLDQATTAKQSLGD